MTEGRHHSEKRRFWLRLKATLASLYFASMFFVLGPVAVLYSTRDEPWQLGSMYCAAPGAILIVIANVWVARLVGEFIRVGDGTHVPIDPPRHFVVSDAYSWTRNPMYSAYIVTVLGEAMLFASFALVLYAAVLGLIAHLYVVFREEPLLESRFGSSYKTYQSRVPRWGVRLGSDPASDHAP